MIKKFMTYLSEEDNREWTEISKEDKKIIIQRMIIKIIVFSLFFIGVPYVFATLTLYLLT